MSFTVLNCQHTHSTVYEAKVCNGLIRHESPAKAYSPPTPIAPPVTPYKDRPETMSSRQEYVLRHVYKARDRQLLDANSRRLSMNQASSLIDDFKAGRISMEDSRLVPVQESAKITFIKSMIDTVPDGYYAVAADSDTPLRFYRLSTGKPKSNYPGARKLQSQHSDDLILRAVFWPSSSVQQYSGFREDDLMLIIADPEGSGIAYGRKLGHCCRCNKALTDERSRHYGIGPECEKHWPHIISRVDEDQRLNAS